MTSIPSVLESRRRCLRRSRTVRRTRWVLTARRPRIVAALAGRDEVAARVPVVEREALDVVGQVPARVDDPVDPVARCRRPDLPGTVSTAAVGSVPPPPAPPPSAIATTIETPAEVPAFPVASWAFAVKVCVPLSAVRIGIGERRRVLAPAAEAVLIEVDPHRLVRGGSRHHHALRPHVGSPGRRVDDGDRRGRAVGRRGRGPRGGGVGPGVAGVGGMAAGSGRALPCSGGPVCSTGPGVGAVSDCRRTTSCGARTPASRLYTAARPRPRLVSANSIALPRRTSDVT